MNPEPTYGVLRKYVTRCDSYLEALYECYAAAGDVLVVSHDGGITWAEAV